MSFWTKSDGSTINKETATTTYEDKGSEPIPDGTTVIAAPTAVKWDEYEGVRYISIRWDVVDGQYKKRVIFQKLHVCSAKDTKRNRSLDIFASIAKNAGGRLLDLDSEPTNADLADILNKPMSIRLRVWDMDGKTGNWVDAVSPVGGNSAPAPKPAKSQPKPAETFDNDIPF